MSFYIRKALSVGPFRFNLSRSGVGVSAGVKGLRFGTGPKGNYVHMGRGGLYYRKMLKSPGESTSSAPADVASQPAPAPSLPSPDTLQEIDSGSIQQMTDSSATELLKELNSKRSLTRIFPIAIAVSLLLLFVLVTGHRPVWQVAAGAMIGVGICVFAHYRDEVRKTVVVLYDFEDQASQSYERLHDAFDDLRSCGRVWHMEASGSVKDSKYHAGASTVVRRKPITLSKGAVPYLKTNVEIPIIPVGRQLLALMPERVLVFDSGSVGAIPYSEVSVAASQSRFIEDGSVPHDSQIIERTWKYVNKKGGPDKRFKDNRELPVVMYEEIRLTSNSGLNEIIQVSCPGKGERLRSAFAGMTA